MSAPIQEPIKSTEINLSWEDTNGRQSKAFVTVKELAEFLKANPGLAKSVGYKIITEEERKQKEERFRSALGMRLKIPPKKE